MKKEERPVLRLERVETSDDGTFGRLIFPDLTHLKTGELPWRDNKKGLSCIPPPRNLNRRYLVTWTHSPRLKRKTYRLQDVPGHEGILIHPFNYAGDHEKGKKDESDGCIGLGMEIGKDWNDGQTRLNLSKIAVAVLETRMAGKDFDLDVSWV